MFIKKKEKVIVAMSGGVDSSVSAWILKQKGYHVEGLFMKNWEENDNSNYCSSEKDLKDVQDVCSQLKIFLHKINFSFEYWETVFNVFLSEHLIGRTPNPDVLCNKEIKFKVFFEFCIQDLNADYIATGHYVRKKKVKNKYILLRGIDINKDQSYFLYTIKQNVLKKCIFPIGSLLKSQVRKIAHQLNLTIANKKDSTGICFINPKNIKNFLNNYLPQKYGNIVTIKGEIIGKHIGLAHYTLGQRKGLAIGGLKNFSNIPWYVVEKNISNNSLVVAQGINNKFLMSVGLIANKLHWINHVNLKKILGCSVKTRYRHIDVFCQVFSYKIDSVKVIFKEPVSSVTPGQSVVFYINEICLGGGTIEQKLSLCDVKC